MTLATDYLGLDALLSAEELAWRDMVRAFVRDRIKPNIKEWYEKACLLYTSPSPRDS